MSPLFVTCELLMMTCWKGIFHAIKLYVCQLIERKGRGEARFRFLDFNFVCLVLGAYNMPLRKSFLCSLGFVSLSVSLFHFFVLKFLDGTAGDKSFQDVISASKWWCLGLTELCSGRGNQDSRVMGESSVTEGYVLNILTVHRKESTL